MVPGEPEAEPDALTQWVTQKAPRNFFKQTRDQRVVTVFRRIVHWAQTEGQFTPVAKAQFASAADGWLIAFAKVNKRTVVTQEAYAPGVKKAVKIPNVCVEFDVPCCDTFDMLRGVGEQFALKARRKKR